MWGLGYAVVEAQKKKLMKRVLRVADAEEPLPPLIAAHLTMLVPRGGAADRLRDGGVRRLHRRVVVDFLLVAVIGAMCFAGLGLTASRVRTNEAANGLMNLIMMPMWILSGVFFSSANFPAAMQPIIKHWLALNDALRAVMLDGASLSAVAAGRACAAWAWSGSSPPGSAAGRAWRRWLRAYSVGPLTGSVRLSTQLARQPPPCRPNARGNAPFPAPAPDPGRRPPGARSRADYLDRWRCAAQRRAGPPAAPGRGVHQRLPGPRDDGDGAGPCDGALRATRVRRAARRTRACPTPRRPDGWWGVPGPGASPWRFRGTELFDWIQARYPDARALWVSRKDPHHAVGEGASAGLLVRLGPVHHEPVCATDWVKAFNVAMIPARVPAPLEPAPQAVRLSGAGQRAVREQRQGGHLPAHVPRSDSRRRS